MVATKRFYIICDEEVVAELKTFCFPLPPYNEDIPSAQEHVFT